MNSLDTSSLKLYDIVRGNQHPKQPDRMIVEIAATRVRYVTEKGAATIERTVERKTFDRWARENQVRKVG